MAHKYGYLIAVLAGFAPAVGTVRGQGEEPVPPAIRFCVFSTVPIINLAYVVADKPVRRIQEMVFFPSARSPVYESLRPGPLEFVDARTKEVLAWATVPDGINEALLIFAPVARTARVKERYHVYVHDDGNARSRSGSLTLLNFSGLMLSGRIAEKRVEVGAGLNGPFAAGSAATVELFVRYHSRDFRSYVDTLALQANQRALLILLPPFRRGSLEVQSRLLADDLPRRPKSGARGRD